MTENQTGSHLHKTCGLILSRARSAIYLLSMIHLVPCKQVEMYLMVKDSGGDANDDSSSTYHPLSFKCVNVTGDEIDDGELF